MDSKIVSIEFHSDENESAWDQFNDFCKLKNIHRQNIVSINYARSFDEQSSILLVYEGNN